MRTDADACDCTRRLHGHREPSPLKDDWEITSLAAPGNRTRDSTAPGVWGRHSTNGGPEFCIAGFHVVVGTSRQVRKNIKPETQDLSTMSDLGERQTDLDRERERKRERE